MPLGHRELHGWCQAASRARAGLAWAGSTWHMPTLGPKVPVALQARPLLRAALALRGPHPTRAQRPKGVRLPAPSLTLAGTSVLPRAEVSTRL